MRSGSGMHCDNIEKSQVAVCYGVMRWKMRFKNRHSSSKKPGMGVTPMAPARDWHCAAAEDSDGQTFRVGQERLDSNDLRSRKQQKGDFCQDELSLEMLASILHALAKLAARHSLLPKGSRAQKVDGPVVSPHLQRVMCPKGPIDSVALRKIELSGQCSAS